jgi:Na+-driven multidrug efflux pump
MANALDTLCSNAFGAKEYKLTGLHAQRGMVILTITSLPIIGFWFFTEKILVLGNVNAEIAYLAQQWVYWQMISIIPKNLSNAFQKFLFAQSIVIPQIVSVAFASGTYALAAYILMYRTHLGYIGAAIAVPITETTLLVAMVVVYIIYYFYYKWIKKKNLAAIGDLNVSRGGSYFFEDESNVEDLTTINNFSTNYLINADATEHLELKEGIDDNNDRESKLAEAEDELLALNTWHSPFTWRLFKGWWEFFKLGLPAAVSLLIEWGSFEVNAFFISLSIKNSSTTNTSTPIAVHALLVNTAGMFFFVCFCLIVLFDCFV